MELLKKSSFFIVIGIVIVLFLFLTRDTDKDETSSELQAIVSSGNQSEEVTEEQQSLTSIVDVKGEVNDPGVYEFDSDARVNDVIEQAGGFTSAADQTQVNLAQRVQDEMIIIVPQEGTSIPEEGDAENVASGDQIRINYATQSEIESLSGIGPSKAQAIIQYRDEHGFFQTADDLLEVSGIGEKTLENFKDDIIVP